MSEIPVMWFKMEKYREMGDYYFNIMKNLVIRFFDEHKVDGIEFNILYSDCEQTCKKPMSKERILNALNIIHTIQNAKISVDI